jgi:hypothetical protein
MGMPREPKTAKYFVALLSSDADLASNVEKDLSLLVGEIDGRTAAVPWKITKYYEEEMGPDLWRHFVSLAAPQSPENLAAIKLKTQEIEDRYRAPHSSARRINLDPGYLDELKVVLASTKNAGQRVYLRSGIYAEVTLLYHHGEFHRLEHTYADYAWPETIAFFNRIRASYLTQLRQQG